MQMEFKIVATNQAEMEKLASIVAIIAAGGVVDKSGVGKAAPALDVAPKKLKAAALDDGGEDIEIPAPKKKSAVKVVDEDDDISVPTDDGEDDGEIELPKTKKKTAAAPAAADDDSDEIPVKKKGPGRPPKNKVPVDDGDSEEVAETKSQSKPKYTQDDIVKAFQAKAKKDRDFCYKVLKKYDAVNAREVDPKDYNAVMKELTT